MILKKHKILLIIHYILIYLLIISHGSVIYSEYELNYIPQTLIITLCILIIMIRKIKFTKVNIIYACALIVLIIIIRLMNDGGLGPKLFLDMISLYLITYTTYRYDKENFFNRFLNILLFISIISLIGWSISKIDEYMLIKLLGKGYSFLGVRDNYFGRIFFVYQLGSSRNLGIFYEPGVYQILLTCSIYYILFYKDRLCIKNKKATMSLIIFTITLLTTQSTTGYVGFIIIVAMYILNKSNNKEEIKLKKTFMIVAIIISVIVVGDYVMNNEQSFWYLNIVEKLNETTANNLLNTNRISSGQARLTTIMLSLQLFMQNPLGVGYSKFDQLEASLFSFDSATGGCILFKHLATSGIIIYIMTLYVVFIPAYKNKKNMISFITFILLYVNITLAQSQMMYPMLLLAGQIRINTNKKIYKDKVRS